VGTGVGQQYRLAESVIQHVRLENLAVGQWLFRCVLPPRDRLTGVVGVRGSVALQRHRHRQHAAPSRPAGSRVGAERSAPNLPSDFRYRIAVSRRFYYIRGRVPRAQPSTSIGNRSPVNGL